MKAALVMVLMISLALGGYYLWVTPSSKVNKKLLVAIVSYDIVALTLGHFVFKAI